MTANPLDLATRAGAEAGWRATENAQRYRYLATGARSYVNGQWIVFAREHPDSAPYRSEFMRAAGYLA